MNSSRRDLRRAVQDWRVTRAPSRAPSRNATPRYYRRPFNVLPILRVAAIVVALMLAFDAFTRYANATGLTP